MYSKFINYLKEKPSLYAPSSAPFWDDEHISEYMLKAHLDPEIDAASRRHDFIEQSAKWIAQYCKVRPGMKLLDLGCGPGLSAKRASGSQGWTIPGVPSRMPGNTRRRRRFRSNIIIKIIWKWITGRNLMQPF